MKNIKFLSVVAAVFLVLTACGDKDASQDNTVGSPAAMEQMSDDTSVAKSDIVADIVAKIVADANGQVRYDRSQDEKTGKQQRQVFIEIVGSSADNFVDKAEGYFEGTGYVLGPVRSDEHGVRMTFVNEGSSPIRFLARNAAMGPALKVEGATSSVYITQDP